MAIIDLILATRLHNNKLLNFIVHVELATGEIKSRTAEFRGLIIQTFPSGLVQIKGSFHVYKNNGFHNYDDFTSSDLRKVIESFKSDLGLDPTKMRIHNLEFGVNLNTEFSPNDFLNALYGFKWKPFNRMDIKGKGFGKECKAFSEYFLKIYNKGMQYNQPPNVLRFEKKVVSMRAIRQGILNLSDLVDKNLWNCCFLQLIEILDDLIIIETIDSSLLNKNELRLFNNVINQSKWLTFSRDQRKRYKKGFNLIVLQYGNEHYKQKLNKLITDKAQMLIEN